MKGKSSDRSYYKDRAVIPSGDIYDKRNEKIHFFLEPYIRLSDHGERIRILDSGSGYGIDILSLKEKLPAGSCYYVGLEISSSQVHLNNNNFKQRNITDVNFVVGDGKKLPFQDNTFQIVISNQVIEHIGDKEDYLREAYRVLEKRGVLLITTGNRVFPWEGHLLLPFIPWLPKSFAVKLLKLLYVRDTKKKNYYQNVYPLSTLYLERLLKKCGFEPEYVTQKLLFDTQVLLAEPRMRKSRFFRIIAKLLSLLSIVPLSRVLIKFGFPYVAFIGIANKKKL